jgi:hypothetical protein
MIFAIVFILVFLLLQVEIFNLFKYSCFGCGLKAGFKSEFQCKDCGTENNNYGEPSQHSCFNPDYCAICTRNRQRVKEISFSSTNYSGSVFCDLCLHNHQIRLTLTKNEQFTSLYRHPLTCKNCEELVKRRIEYINQEFRKDVLYKRLLMSKQLHLNQIAKTDYNHYLDEFTRYIISALQLLVVCVNCSEYIDWTLLSPLILFIPVFKSKASITLKNCLILAFQLLSSVYLVKIEEEHKSSLQIFLITWVLGGYLLNFKSLLKGLTRNPWAMGINIKEDEENEHDIVNPLSLN